MAKALSLAKSTAFSFISLLSSAILGIGLTALVARVLAPEAMGHYSLVVWFTSLAGLIANLGYVTTATRFMAERLGRDRPDEAAGVLAHAVRNVFWTGLAVTAGVLALAPFAPRLYPDLPITLYLAIGALGILPTAMTALFAGACQGLQRYDWMAAVTGLGTVLTLGGAIAVLLSGGGIPGLLAVTAGVAAVSSLAYALLLARWNPGFWQGRLDASEARQLKRFQWAVFAMLGLDAIVWQRSELFFLGAWAPAQQVAFYSLAFGLSTMAMKLLPGTLVGLLIPMMARSEGAGDREATAQVFTRSCRAMAMLAVPVAVGGSLLSLPLVHVLYGAEYLPVAGLLSALLIAGALVMIYGYPASSVLYSTGGERYLVKVGISVAVVNLVLDVALIPFWGAWGAVAANALAQITSLGPGLWGAYKYAGVRPPVKVLVPVGLATALMALPVWLIVSHTPAWMAMLIAPVAGGLFYAVALWLTGALDATERKLVIGLFRKLAQRKVIPQAD
ncbi:putative cell division protein YtgP [compost metagenome]